MKQIKIKRTVIGMYASYEDIPRPLKYEFKEL